MFFRFLILFLCLLLFFYLYFSGEKRVFVTFNAHDRTNGDGTETLEASKIVMHQDYDRVALSNDVAILHFDDTEVR